MTIELQLDHSQKIAQTVQIRQHAFTSDIPVSEGGDDAGPSPHDLYDAALGACKALTVMWYARKKGIPVEDIQTVVTHDDAQERQGVYRLTAHLKVQGALSDAQVEELQRVADKCPVHKLMTKVSTEISTTLECVAS